MLGLLASSLACAPEVSKKDLAASARDKAVSVKMLSVSVIMLSRELT